MKAFHWQNFLELIINKSKFMLEFFFVRYVMCYSIPQKRNNHTVIVCNQDKKQKKMLTFF